MILRCSHGLKANFACHRYFCDPSCGSTNESDHPLFQAKGILCACVIHKTSFSKTHSQALCSVKSVVTAVTAVIWKIDNLLKLDKFFFLNAGAVSIGSSALYCGGRGEV